MVATVLTAGKLVQINSTNTIPLRIWYIQHLGKLLTDLHVQSHILSRFFKLFFLKTSRITENNKLGKAIIRKVLNTELKAAKQNNLKEICCIFLECHKRETSICIPTCKIQS